MKKLLMIISILTFSLFSYSQTTFEKTYVHPNSPYENFGYGVQVEQNTNNGYTILSVVPGDWFSFSYIIETDEYGDTVFTKSLQDYELSGMRDFCFTDDGGLLLVGGSSYWVSYLEMMRLNSNLDTIWTKIGDRGVGMTVLADSDFNYYVGYGNLDKINGQGDTIWRKNYYPHSVQYYDLIFTSSNNMVLLAVDEYNYTATYITKINLDGDLIWQQHQDGWIFKSICEAENGDFLLCGCDAYGSIFIIMRLDSLGNFMWYEEYNYGYDEYLPPKICNAGDGNFIVCMSSGALLKINGEGEELWYTEYGDGLYDVKMTNDDCIISTGNSDGNYTTYLVKTDQNGIITHLADRTTQSESSLVLYPNPVESGITVRYLLPLSGFRLPEIVNCQLSIFDVNGRLVDEMKVEGGEFSFDVSHLQSGIYLIEARTDTGAMRGKFIKR